MTDKPDFSQSPELIINQLRTSWPDDFWSYLGGLFGLSPQGTYTWNITDVTYGFAIVLNDEQKAFAREAFEMWDDLIAINLTEGPTVADPWTSTSNNITFSYAPISADLSGQTEWDPGESTLSKVNIAINTEYASDAITYGSDGLLTYLHEIGHSLGLSHPGHYNGSASYGPDAEYIQDTEQYTVMSYFYAGSDIDNTAIYFDGHTFRHPSTPMLHDILAVQAVYGADMTTRTGDDVYGFNASFSGPYRGAFDFTQNTAPVVAIWDAGGNDTLDCSGFSNAQTIYLHPGSYSSVGGLTDNVAIAYNCIIENAIGGSGSDTILGNEINNLLDGGPGNDTLFGGAGGDTLKGGPGFDILYGGPDGDIMIGGPGDDQYYVDTPDHAPLATGAIALAITSPDPTIHNGDQVIENPGEGYHDLVFSTISYALPDNVEDLTLARGAGDINGYGNNLNNIIHGNEGVNTMVGGNGNDTYYVDTAATLTSLGDWTIYFPGDQVIENPNEGFDTVWASISYALPDNVEDLRLASGAGNINGYGNGLANEIYGNEGWNTLYGYDGNDLLDGRAGADTMVGGIGNDLYYVDTAATSVRTITKGGFPLYLPGDEVIENPNEGFDTVWASISYALPDNVEDLALAPGAGNINGYGNDLANGLFGNSGNNALSGGGGSDVLAGALGRDTLAGGADRDVFDFNDLAESAVGAGNRDVITDFQRGLDVIDLTNIDANSSRSGDQGFRFIGTHAFGGRAGDLRYESFDQAGTANDVTVISGDVNGDRIADFEIEIPGIVQLSSRDFLL